MLVEGKGGRAGEGDDGLPPTPVSRDRCRLTALSCRTYRLIVNKQALCITGLPDANDRNDFMRPDSTEFKFKSKLQSLGSREGNTLLVCVHAPTPEMSSVQAGRRARARRARSDLAHLTPPPWPCATT